MTDEGTTGAQPAESDAAPAGEAQSPPAHAETDHKKILDAQQVAEQAVSDSLYSAGLGRRARNQAPQS